LTVVFSRRTLMAGVRLPRITTADLIFDRIIWDQSLAPQSDFVVGYEDRFLGLVEVAFDKFDKSEIPFHRVRFFKVRKKDHIANLLPSATRQSSLGSSHTCRPSDSSGLCVSLSHPRTRRRPARSSAQACVTCGCLQARRTRGSCCPVCRSRTVTVHSCVFARRGEATSHKHPTASTCAQTRLPFHLSRRGGPMTAQ